MLRIQLFQNGWHRGERRTVMAILTCRAFMAAILLTEITHFGCYPHVNASLKILPSSSIRATEGMRLDVNCTYTGKLDPNIRLRWCRVHRNGAQDKKEMKCYAQSESKVLPMRLPSVNRTDAGSYSCVMEHMVRGRMDIKNLHLMVDSRGTNYAGYPEPPTKFCRSTDFRCVDKGNICIQRQYRCDGNENCPDGSDERGCSECGKDQFLCKNGACIDKGRVCDDRYDCNDKSDEECYQLTDFSLKNQEDKHYRTSPTTVTVAEDDSDDQMTWLKTTVYTVIACTVGVVLLISIVVIAVFRIKMKRAAVRRAIRAAERRRQRQARNNIEDNRNMSSFVESEPFITSASNTTFGGNIIVNVNNGIQYVPNSDVTAHIQLPPSYNEVLAESQREGIPGRHSPPPAYSTIDRNPNRGSVATTSPGHRPVGVADPFTSNVLDSCVNVDQDVNQLDHTDIQCVNDVNQRVNDANQSRSNRNTLVEISEHEPFVASNHGNQECNTPTSLAAGETVPSQSRNLTSTSSQTAPWRPKQIHVHGGQILLDGDSPEQSTCTNQNSPPIVLPANEQSSGKPAVLQVHDGQILLTNQDAEGATANLPENFDSNSSGQLDVKGGQIVFKSS